MLIVESDSDLTWPPPDPDRIPWISGSSPGDEVSGDKWNNSEATKSSTVGGPSSSNSAKGVRRRLNINIPNEAIPLGDETSSDDLTHDLDNGNAWRNSEGEGLEDFGVESVNDPVP